MKQSACPAEEEAEEEVGKGEQADEGVEAAETESVVCKCEMCGQNTESWERAFLPDKMELLAWSKTNWSVKRQMNVKSGRECFHCALERRSKYWGSLTKPKLMKEFEKDPTKKEEFQVKRDARVRGEVAYGRSAQPAQTMIKDKETHSREQFIQSHFYFLDDYLSIVDAPSTLKTLSEKADYLMRNHKQKIKKDLLGRYGVEETQLPQGAAFTIKRGVAQESTLEGVTVFGDEEDAQGAFQQHIADGDDEEPNFETGPTPATTTAPVGTTGSPLATRGRVGQEHVPSIAMMVGSKSPTSTSGPPSPKRSLAPGGGHAFPPGMLSRTRARQLDLAPASEATVSSGGAGENTAPATATAKPVAVEKKERFHMSKLKTNSPAKLKSFGQQLFTESAEFSFANLWDQAFSAREVKDVTPIGPQREFVKNSSGAKIRFSFIFIIFIAAFQDGG